MTTPVFRIQQLTCATCGYRPRCRIRTYGEVEIMPNCDSCGRSSARQMVVRARSYER